LQDVFDIRSYYFCFSHLTSLQDWGTARTLFIAENQDLPDHVYVQYMPIYPRWGSACHAAGETQSGQGLERTWGHLETAKIYYQQTHHARDLESICEAVSEREDQHKDDTFATEPTIAKQNWDVVSDYHSSEPGIDLKSSAYYSLKDGRSLTRQEATGNATSIGGYVIYIPNDAASSQWKEDAVNQSAGTDKSAGITLRQIALQQGIAKDRTCVSSKPTEVKVVFMKIVGGHLKNNTPSPLEGEDTHSFLRRRSQRDLSSYQMLGGGERKKPPKKKRKGGSINDAHEQDLENKKWSKDVQAAVTSELEKGLPKDPNDDTEEQSEAREWLAECESKLPTRKPSMRYQWRRNKA
jgi:hypothetical protein